LYVYCVELLFNFSIKTVKECGAVGEMKIGRGTEVLR
jgi:hypothetical protein